MEMGLIRPVFGFGLVALALLAGCTEDADVAVGGAEDVPSAVAAKGDGTVCDLPSTKGLKIEWEASAGGGKSVRVTNLRDVTGVVKLTRAVVTTEGTESTEIGESTLGPAQSVVLPVPAVDAPAGGDATSLHVIGEAEFSDGERAGGSAALRLAPAAKAAAAITPGDIGGNAGIVIPSGWRRTQMCFLYPGSFGGSYGEDYFTEGVPTYRPAYGLRVNLRGHSSFTLGEYLDENGCTSVRDFPVGGIDVRIYSRGEIRGANFDVVDDAQDSEIQSHDFGVLLLATSSAQTFRFDPTGTAASDAFNVAQAAGWVFRRLIMGDPADLLIVANAEGYDKSEYSARYRRIALQAGDHDNKWTIAHEIGHFAMHSYTDFGSATSCSDHDAVSHKNQKCAMQEGFANWWAAQSFNFIGQAGCQYSKVNCNNGLETGYSCSDKSKLPFKVLETCHAGEDMTGGGNETDWSRMLWNLRAPSTGVTTEDIMDWISSANNSTAWTSYNVYQLLNSRANAIGGTLNTLFDVHKLEHGINH